jgi:hypothetical protein
MRIYLATWLFEPKQGIALTRTSAWKRLLSFWHTRERAGEFPSYALTGRNDEDILGGKLCHGKD